MDSYIPVVHAAVLSDIYGNPSIKWNSKGKKKDIILLVRVWN